MFEFGVLLIVRKILFECFYDGFGGYYFGVCVVIVVYLVYECLMDFIGDVLFW